MAKIDPRLLPLIEALSASGADWLAFEILDGIRTGRRAEDSEEELRDARRAVSAFRQKGEPLAERESGHDFADPLLRTIRSILPRTMFLIGCQTRSRC
jgi:hypothetical protein